MTSACLNWPIQDQQQQQQLQSAGKRSRRRCRRRPVPDATATIYHLLRRYTLTTAEMASHGYPLPVAGHPSRARVPVTTAKARTTAVQDGGASVRRSCCRCGADFRLTKDGEYETLDECVYHWGRLRRSPTESQPTYSCCSGVEGCSRAALHVASDRLGSNGFEDGYTLTLPPADGGEFLGVCALDCEMCFTAHGLEVARVTLVQLDGCVLYDRLVRTASPVVDYNTRFSGLSEQDFVDVERTVGLADVQVDLLRLVSADTVLVGHGLENDLRALRLLHPTVVDTAALFPHFLGLPFRRSLRSLASIHLRREIQSEKSTTGRRQGHDSAEDARAALDLVFFKLSEVLLRPSR